MTTPLLPKAIEILKKYRHNLRAAVTGTVFPVISNQKVNAYLKEIAEICGIKKNMTFHYENCHYTDLRQGIGKEDQ